MRAAYIPRILNRLARAFAYLGGATVAAIGIMSAVSIIGRSVIGRPILGDFELVEIGTAVAGTLFLPFCQATGAGLDRFGCLLMAIMFAAVGWRAIYGSIDLRHNGETSMLLSFPLWIGYAGIVPGTLVAAIIALAQSFGIKVAERMTND